MKCPYCGSEMEKGTLRSRGGNYFLPEGERSKIVWYTKNAMKRANAIPLPPSPWSMEPVQWPKAYCCRNCRKIILEYEEITESR